MARTAVLYARVSSRAQDERGLSIPAQLAELRAWAEREGVRVVGEVADTGGKGSKRGDLERPGLDRLYDLCEARGVDFVVAQSWERFGEGDVPQWIGHRLASVGGARLRTPDDPNDEEDDGANLLRLVGSWNAARERKTTARRSRSRKLELARSGCIVPGHTPTYGFSYAGGHRARRYEVREEHAEVVRRIFRMIADGSSVRTVARTLDREGIPTPPNPAKEKNPSIGRGWNRQFIRNLVRNDVYRPHTAEELIALVEAEHLRAGVPAEPGCGVWWYCGRDYEGNTHRVAVPVPNAGVPRGTVEAARARLDGNKPASSAGDRVWPLSGGLLRCSGCGLAMQTHTVKSPRHDRIHRYYRCPCHQHTRKGTCPDPVNVPAERAEKATWHFVVRLETEPGRILALLERRIEKERQRLRVDPEKELRDSRRRIDATTARRAAYQDQQAAGLMTLDELRVRLEGLAEEREQLEQEAEAVGRRGEDLRELEEIRGYYARAVEPGEDGWLMSNALADQRTYMRARMLEEGDGPFQRTRYKALKLEVRAVSRDELELRGIFGTESVYISTTLSSRPCTPTTRPGQ